ncbi:MAG: serine hydrolase domain-containing protein [Pirellulaceae bacterium]|nr:beta-lactamase family protein [Planctomycetales bacterium]
MTSKWNRRQLLRGIVAVPALAFADRAVGAANVPVVSVAGATDSETTAIIGHVSEFMQRYSVPGMSLAMTHAGQLKLLVCAGFANRESLEQITPRHRFRVASVSKPITSMTVMKLASGGQVNLEQRVFGDDGVLGYGDDIAALGDENGQRLKSITIRHLLEHTAGGWGNQTRDPMFTDDALDLDHESLIRWTLANRPLEHPPGTHYAYSNFGYCLVGRIVAKAVGRPYESAVRSTILDPHGLHDATFQIGGNSLDDRQELEVVYYGQNSDPYGRRMNVRRMDAHGGWVASPTDLVRLVNRVDGFPGQPDLLSHDWIRTMTTPSTANPNYAKGWAVNSSNNWWHMGSFTGGSSIVARIHDDHCWAMTVNTRSQEPDYMQQVDALPWKIRRCVTTWGSHDLF